MKILESTLCGFLLLFLTLAPCLLDAEEPLPPPSTYSQAMRNVAPIQELQSICTPGRQQPKQRVVTLGTGFYVLRDEAGELTTWLVTARHVVENSADLFTKSLTAPGQKEVFLVLPQAKWIYHPGPNPQGRTPIDVAVMNVLVPQKTISFRYCPTECSNDPATGQRSQNHLTEPPEPTERVLFFGYPGSDVVPGEIPPFVRSGIVAYSVPNAWLNIQGKPLADDSMFYVDAPAFGGNSGGPVMLEPNVLMGKVSLLGLVTAGNPSDRYTLVTSVKRIKETIEHATKHLQLPEKAWTTKSPTLSHPCKDADKGSG